MGLSRHRIFPFSKKAKRIHNLYKTAFPPEERLPFSLLLVNSWRRLADFYAYYDGDEFVGLAYTIADQDLYYLLFLAVNEQLHSKGYGSQILQDLQKEAGKRPFMLTIEPVDATADNYQQRVKRLNFYERNGLQLTQHFYQEGQESYQIMQTAAVDLAAFEKLMRKAFLWLIPIKIS